MAIQETNIPTNTTFSIQEYTVITSTSNTDTPKPFTLTKPNWKNKQNWQGPREYAGVGIIYHEDFQPAVLYYKQYNGRSMELGLRTKSHPLIINSILAPHNAREEHEKHKFWKQITKETNEHKNALHITLGGHKCKMALQ